MPTFFLLPARVILLFAFGAFGAFAFLFIPESGLAAVAPGGSPQEIFESIAQASRELADPKSSTQAAQSIESHFDLPQLTQGVLGSHSKRFSSTQQSQIQGLLKQIITKTVYPEAPKFFQDVAIRVTGTTPTAKGLRKVDALVTKQNASTQKVQNSSISYWLNDQNRVVDISVDGESWVENLNMQFDEVISKKGPKELITRLQKRLSELKARL